MNCRLESGFYLWVSGLPGTAPRITCAVTGVPVGGMEEQRRSWLSVPSSFQGETEGRSGTIQEVG